MRLSVLAGVSDGKPDTGGAPNDVRELKYAYGVTRAKLLATLSTQTPYDPANNAENYALYALARYVMLREGFYPDLPIMDFGNDMAVLTNEMIQDGEREKFACFEMPDVLYVHEAPVSPFPGQKLLRIPEGLTFCFSRPLLKGVNEIGDPLSSSATSFRSSVWNRTTLHFWLLLLTYTGANFIL